jgi:hypothetical protein
LTERPLAATKFLVPELPGRHVPHEHPHPHGALDAAAQLPLTVVVGVPGAGKSVMLQSWLRDRPGLRPAWLSCDARDADPVAFWLALSATLTQAWPGRWLDVADLLAENEPDLDDVAVNPARAVRKHAHPHLAGMARVRSGQAPAWFTSVRPPGRLGLDSEP